MYKNFELGRILPIPNFLKAKFVASCAKIVGYSLANYLAGHWSKTFKPLRKLQKQPTEIKVMMTALQQWKRQRLYITMVVISPQVPKTNKKKTGFFILLFAIPFQIPDLSKPKWPQEKSWTTHCNIKDHIYQISEIKMTKLYTSVLIHLRTVYYFNFTKCHFRITPI